MFIPVSTRPRRKFFASQSRAITTTWHRCQSTFNEYASPIIPNTELSRCSTFRRHGNGYRKKLLTDSFIAAGGRSSSGITVKCVLISVGIPSRTICFHPRSICFHHRGSPSNSDSVPGVFRWIRRVPIIPILPVRAPGCKNWPAPFPDRMSYKATKPGLVSVLYLSMRYMVLLFIRAPLYVLLVYIHMCAVFWLFWLSYQYLSSDWLERLLFCISLGSWVISLTVLGASVTNLNEPPRALATSTIMWVRS